MDRSRRAFRFTCRAQDVYKRQVIESPVNHRSVLVLSLDRIATASGDGIVRVFDAQLRLVGWLEVLREGYLWMTRPVDVRPGWLYTDRPELVDVGERSGAAVQALSLIHI